MSKDQPNLYIQSSGHSNILYQNAAVSKKHNQHSADEHRWHAIFLLLASTMQMVLSTIFIYTTWKKIRYWIKGEKKRVKAVSLGQKTIENTEIDSSLSSK